MQQMRPIFDVQDMRQTHPLICMERVMVQEPVWARARMALINRSDLCVFYAGVFAGGSKRKCVEVHKSNITGTSEIMCPGDVVPEATPKK
jgi:hypothetical protein